MCIRDRLLTALVDERIAVADALLAQGADVDAPNFYNDENLSLIHVSEPTRPY